jgi:hypothetical protein
VEIKMKFKFALPIIITLSLIACSKSEIEKKSTPELLQEMDSLNIAIENMLTFSSSHPVEVQKQIVCISYPILYKELYMPVTLEYAKRGDFKDTTKESLLNDFNTVQQSYLASLQINC